MNIKKFLVCPTCQNNGFFRPLGELDDFGRLVIKRRLDYTIIDGAEYNVICGNCGEMVFVKRVNPVVLAGERGTKNEVSNDGLTWFFGSSLNQGTILQGS